MATICLSAALAMASLPAGAQHTAYSLRHDVPETALETPLQSLDTPVKADSLPQTLNIRPMAIPDTLHKSNKRDWNTWRPNAKRALWLAMVLPGAGQIYNRKFWKLPIIYGGFVGCVYAMRWNNMMYKDYSQAYLDIMDDDPTTQSYNQFLHLGNTITSDNLTRWQEIFRKRKDRYRRWRDLSFFTMLGVYAISVIDAYVDASLSEFDISPDLSFHITPAVIGSQCGNGQLSSGTGIGLQCSLVF